MLYFESIIFVLSEIKFGATRGICDVDDHFFESHVKKFLKCQVLSITSIMDENMEHFWTPDFHFIDPTSHHTLYINLSTFKNSCIAL